MSNIFVIAGNSAAGKTFLMSNAERLGKHLSVVKKMTTRKPRDNEKMLTDYDLQFGFSIEEVKNCDLHFSYRDEWYGIRIKDIDDILARDKNPILVIRRISIITELKQRYPDTVFTILCQSCFDENELADFLLKRNIPKKEVDSRLSSRFEKECRQEYQKNMNIFDRVIINYYDHRFLEEAGMFVEEIISKRGERQ